MAGLAGLVAITEWLLLPVPDVSWLLYAAGRVSLGAHYGLEVADVAPPPIIWYSAAGVRLARWLGVTPWHGFLITLFLTIATSLVLLWGVARRSVGWIGAGAPVLLGAAMLALGALPWGAFGEREHVALVLVLPYVVLFAVREEGGAVPIGLAAVVGVLAGFGFAIKPHFAAPWAMLAGGVLVRRRGLALSRRPEFLASAATALACVLAVFWLEPDYLHFVGRFARLYLDYVQRDPTFVALVGESNGAVVVLLTVLTAVVLWRRVPEPTQPTVLYLMLAATGFYLGAVVQLKGWRYHYLPGVGLSSTVLVVLAATVRAPLPRLVDGLYRTAALVTLTVLFGNVILGNVARLRGTAGPTYDPDYEPALAAVREIGGGQPLAVLSANLASAFPLGSESGVQWAFRYGGLPWLPALYPDQVRTGRIVRHRPYAARSALERSFAEDVLADLRRSTPGLILVPTPAAGSSYYRLFDYLDYFGEVPGFSDFLAAYRPVGRAGVYLVLRHQRLPDNSGSRIWRGTNRPRPRAAGLSEAATWLLLAAASTVVVLGMGSWEQRRASRRHR